MKSSGAEHLTNRHISKFRIAGMRRCIIPDPDLEGCGDAYFRAPNCRNVDMNNSWLRIAEMRRCIIHDSELRRCGDALSRIPNCRDAEMRGCIVPDSELQSSGIPNEENRGRHPRSPGSPIKSSGILVRGLRGPEGKAPEF